MSGVREACDTLEGDLRQTVMWLYRLGSIERPYAAPDGWDSLLWQRSARR